MSKHLLYRKDLLNRTLTRSLLFVVPQLVACLIVLFQAISPAEAAGPLSVKTTNPRYFFDAKGNPVYLTGSYLNEYNLLSGSWEFTSYLDFLQQQNQNFTRVWGWEQSPWIYDNTGQISFSTQPYQRTGPGLALDGGLKFDLTRFNQIYFDQLRSRVLEAGQRGIYVSVMLFEGFSTQKKVGRVNPWLGDPFQQANNINGINGDPNQNGGSEAFFSLDVPSLVSTQEAFARKVVDTLNDLDNVLYEVNGNGLAESLSWQYHMIDYIRRYQKKPANQHPVGISDFYAGAMADVFNSSTDWIVIPETNLNPLPATSKKVLIMEGTPPLSAGEVLSTSPIALVQLLPDTVVSSQSSGISNNAPSSNGVTLVSSSATSSTLTTTQSSSNQQSQVATPTITPNGGIYSGTIAVTLQTTTPGASIYYTTDGQSPTQSSQLYKGKFTVSGSTLVKAKAFKNNFDPSAEASAWFANAAGPVVTPSGLVGYWKFDEGSGTSVADSSGNGNNGTLVNGPLWTAGRVGNALYFDGIDDNVTIADSNSLDLSSSFTLSAWVNPASTFTDFRSILVKNYSYYLYASVAGYCGNGNPLGGFSAATAQTVCQPSPLPINTWTHLAVTYDGSALTLYQNGVAVVTSVVSGTLSPTAGTLEMGASQYGEYFKGLIDEVRIYNRALSGTAIQSIYQQDSATPVQTVATPVISPNGGNYSGSVSVTMQTATSGASVYYTTDGTSPTQSSTLYTGTVTLTSSATVKAKAFKSGYTASAEANASFTVTQPFSFSVSNSGDKSVNAGSSVTNSISTTLVSGNAQAVSFSASGLPTGATASFSSTSCSPTCSSTLTINTSASTPAGGSTITVSATGGGVTKTTTFNLNVSLPTVATPTISPSGGSYTGSVSITTQTATSGASIYYTTDGSTPTQSSALYTGTMNLTSSATVKAQAFKSGYNPSAQASASFTVSQPFSFSVSNSGNESVVAGSSVTNSISATLTSGGAQAVTFSASGLPTGATASFSSTSCSPTCSSTLTINTSGSISAGSSTITVAASGGGMTKTTTFSLTVSLPTVATPAINPNGGSYTGSAFVAMQTATAGASIYYTTDGSTPTQSSTLYNGAITLTSSATVKAKAFKSGFNASAEASASFDVTQGGLVAYWKFDESSGTTVSDSSGNGNTGTLVNGPLWTAGKVGNALYFDGIDDNVTIADSNSLDLSSSFTLSAWVNPASTFTDFRSILVKNYSYYLYASVAGYCGDGSPLGGFDEQTTNAVCQPSPLPINTWTHLALIYNGSTLTLYRNGAAVAASNVSGTLSATTGTLQIGASQFGEYFKGLIDEVRIYNRALSATEIQTIYQQDSIASSQTVTTSVSQPFSFSLSNSGDKPVVAGSSVTNSIATALVSGNSQAVSFSVSGLPTGATGFFSSTSCSPSCSTVLNLVTTGSTPAGNFPITVTSTGGNVTKTTAFTLSVTLALTAATPAVSTTGNVYYVGKTGSNSYSCAQARNQSTPKLTVGAGAACLSAGDTLYIRAGTYSETGGSINLPTATSWAGATTIASFGNELVTFQSSGNPFHLFNTPAAYVIFDGSGGDPTHYGLVFDGITDGWADAIAIGQGAGPFRFQNFEVKNFGANGLTAGTDGNQYMNCKVHHGGTVVFDNPVYIGSSNNLVENCEFYDWAGAVQFYDAGAMNVNNNIIRYNYIHDTSGGVSASMPNSTPSYSYVNDNRAQGIIIYNGTNNQVYGNIIANLRVPTSGIVGGSGSILVGGAASNTGVYNNTVYNSGIGINIGYADGTIVKNNIIYGNSYGDIIDAGTRTILSNNLTSNPLFVNPANEDFRLQSTSPAIDKGVDLSTQGILVDINGVARPQGCCFDIGAYEYNYNSSLATAAP